MTSALTYLLRLYFRFAPAILFRSRYRCFVTVRRGWRHQLNADARRDIGGTQNVVRDELGRERVEAVRVLYRPIRESINAPCPFKR